LHVLKWMHANSCPSGTVAKLGMLAAMGGLMHVLEWADATPGCSDEQDTGTAIMAARSGDLPMLWWLRRHDYSRSESVCYGGRVLPPPRRAAAGSRQPLPVELAHALRRKAGGAAEACGKGVLANGGARDEEVLLGRISLPKRLGRKCTG
jgi:hypothetical protein